MHRDISTHLNQLSNNLTIVNKLIVGAYLEFNSIKLKYNRVILSYIEGNDKKEVSEFIELVKIKNGKFDFEDLIRLFEITIPSKDTITNGAVYTPKSIRDYIVKTSFTAVSSLDHNTIIVGDIACGTGAFLYSVSKEIKRQTQKSFYQIFKEVIKQNIGEQQGFIALERPKF